MEAAATRPWSRAVYQSCSGRREPSAHVTFAQSPAAHTSGAARRASSTSIAPPLASRRPLVARKPVLGTTPIAHTSRSQGTSAAPAASAACVRGASPRRTPASAPSGPRRTGPGRGASPRAHRQEQAVVADRASALEAKRLALGGELRHPLPHPLEAEALVEPAVVGLGVLQPHLAGEDVHEGGAGIEMVVLVGDERDARLAVLPAEGQGRLHAADAVADDHVVHRNETPLLPDETTD